MAADLTRSDTPPAVPGPPPAPPGPTGPRAARLARRMVAAVWAPDPAAMRGIAVTAVIANAVIMMTGAAVRLSESGLGCPHWPRCTTTSLTPTRVPGQTMLNTWIEFGNRLLTYPVVAVSIVALVAAWRFRPPGTDRRRNDLIWLAAALPAGVIAQAVVGGIVVLTKLNPAWVAGHFVLSIAIVAAAVLLHVRCQEGTGPTRPLVRPDLRILSGALVAVTALMIAAGTVVDGAGPLAGNAAAPRFHFHLASFGTTTFAGLTQLHADIGWLLGGLVVALILGLTRSGAPRPAVRWGWTTAVLVAVQGVIGYAQYFGGMPAGLVWVHVCVAVLIWIAVLRLLLALRNRGPLAADPTGIRSPQPGTRGTGLAAADPATRSAAR